MKNISNIKDCYGCGLCATVCAKKIIEITLNKDGFCESRITALQEAIAPIGSKYIQSYTTDVSKVINRKEKHLVTGTPFHVDFFCHSVPSMWVWEKHAKMLEKQTSDVPVTYADTSALEADFGFKPSTSLRDGLRSFAEWYKNYYK